MYNAKTENESLESIITEFLISIKRIEIDISFIVSKWAHLREPCCQHA